MSESVVTSNTYRTHTNGELTRAHVDETVRLCGWVHARRDHGGLIFIDLRDRWGITQLTFNPAINTTAFEAAQKLRSEYVINVSGNVVKRPAAMVNAELKTGEIEIQVMKLNVLSEVESLPFEIATDRPVGEETRLVYRYLDLRRPKMQQLIERRDSFIRHIRSYMHERHFIEVQTPILANSSPEGARDYLVPSRLHPGMFYALPQAPQQFKQLLMVAGFERYFQIAPCFRDEDPRADRHPGEFYQLDLEMSFVEQDDVFTTIEPLLIELTEKFSNKKVVSKPFVRLPWREALSRYGTDKPDLRYGLEIHDVSEVVQGSGFKIFSEALATGGTVRALHVPGGADFSRTQLDALTEKARTAGAGGLAYILCKDEPSSPIMKHLGAEVATKIIKQIGAVKGDALFFAADQWYAACKALGAVREAAAVQLELKDSTRAAWCWITDFPMYEKNVETGQIEFSHNPFSMPQGGLDALTTNDPLSILGYQYDTVLNGYEVSSGAIRNHDPATMYKAFAIAGYGQAEVDQKFGGMISAFRHGAPPHGGMAPGIDRLMMVLWDVESIRDIYAFPKNGRAQDAMMKAPSPVTDAQLRDLHIKLTVAK